MLVRLTTFQMLNSHMGLVAAVLDGVEWMTWCSLQPQISQYLESCFFFTRLSKEDTSSLTTLPHCSSKPSLPTSGSCLLVPLPPFSLSWFLAPPPFFLFYRPEASASSKNLLEIYFQPHPTSTESEALGVGPSCLCFHKPSKRSRCQLVWEPLVYRKVHLKDIQKLIKVVTSM